MAKKKAKSALIYLVLDRSGSMQAIRDATIEGCNRFLDETREVNPNALFSLSLFDHEVTRIYSAVPISQTEKIDRHVYEIRGNTALLDAVGAAVSDIAAMTDRPEKVVVVIMTDGQENSSREYTREAIKATIKQRESEDNWQFIFLGANLDSFSEAGAIGVGRAASSANWQPTYAGTSAVYAMASMAANSYVSGMTGTADVDADEYNMTLTSATAGEAKPISERLKEYKARRATANATPDKK